jgi:hypothetical protein
LVSQVVLAPIVELSYRRYLRTDDTPSVGYSAMRKLFGSSSGERFEALAARSTAELSPIDLSSAEGVITSSVGDIVGRLLADGVAILDERLPESACADLERLATSAECRLTEPLGDGPDSARYDPDDPLAVRYDVLEPHLLANGTVQRLLADRSILAVAARYLGGTPVQDLVAMWWSTQSEAGSSAAAQQYHFDLDRLRFLKLFVYLTDVDAATGPHQFIRGSHRSLPAELRADRRYGDAEVAAHFQTEDQLSITGPRGTMFLADTRGLHRGLRVESGHRLVFQLEYATSLFGAPTTRSVVTPSIPEFADALAQHPRVYRRLCAVN